MDSLDTVTAPPNGPLFALANDRAKESQWRERVIMEMMTDKRPAHYMMKGSDSLFVGAGAAAERLQQGLFALDPSENVTLSLSPPPPSPPLSFSPALCLL